VIRLEYASNGLDQPSGSEFSEFLTGTEDEDV
jgi:hypothetical protein